MQSPITKELLGLAGEYTVASELCRRGVYAQLTLGNRKRTDILVDTGDRMVRIEVKSKQKGEWPSIRGLCRDDDILVLVDFSRRPLEQKPDYYILDFSNWKTVVKKSKKCDPQIIIDDKFQVTYPDGWKGLNLKPLHVDRFKDQWEKITMLLDKS